ncbi:hypothetical protein ACFHW1_04870 [Micromonospora sp. LOL_014]|uniref:hypothetical protein n=1 Tax=Micromonospora sp. LOL_014 TaxID=3345415 RepID=UPI003A8B26BC
MRPTVGRRPSVYRRQPHPIRIDAQTPEQLAERARLAAAFAAAGRRAGAAKAARAAAMAELGELMRLDRDAGPLVGGNAAADLSGISRTYLDKAADDDTAWRETVMCAGRVAEGDRSAAADLHARVPVLDGIWAAQTHIRATGVGDRAAAELVAEYYRIVRRLALGKPVGLVDD